MARGQGLRPTFQVKMRFMFLIRPVELFYHFPPATQFYFRAPPSPLRFQN